MNRIESFQMRKSKFLYKNLVSRINFKIAINNAQKHFN